MNTGFVIHTDGGSRGNPGPAATGFVIADEFGKSIHRDGQYLGIATNNVAEYQAVLDALNWLISYLHPHSGTSAQIHFYLDSQLVVRQLSGEYKIKQAHLTAMANQIHRLISQNRLAVQYHHVPREQNQAADAEVNRILDQHAV